MAEEEKTAEEELKDAVWQWFQKAVVALVLFGSGVLAGWFAWGDYSKVFQHNKELQDQIVDLKNQRETLNTRIARETRDKEVCSRDLQDIQKQLDAAKGAGGGAGTEG